MAVKKPTEAQEAGDWLMQGVVQTLSKGVPVEIGRTKAIAFPAEDVERMKQEAEAWAQKLGKEVVADKGDANGS